MVPLLGSKFLSAGSQYLLSILVMRMTCEEDTSSETIVFALFVKKTPSGFLSAA